MKGDRALQEFQCMLNLFLNSSLHGISGILIIYNLGVGGWGWVGAGFNNLK